MAKMNAALARVTIERYVCSNCWGHLIERFDGDDSIVECHYCEEETTGFVTKQFADRRIEESAGERLEVKGMLIGLGVIENPHSGKSASELSKEMGF